MMDATTRYEEDDEYGGAVPLSLYIDNCEHIIYTRHTQLLASPKLLYLHYFLSALSSCRKLWALKLLGSSPSRATPSSALPPPLPPPEGSAGCLRALGAAAVGLLRPYAHFSRAVEMHDAAMAKVAAARRAGRRSGIPVAGSSPSPTGSTAARGGGDSDGRSVTCAGCWRRLGPLGGRGGAMGA